MTISNIPGDTSWIKWAKSFLSALASIAQVILMNRGIQMLAFQIWTGIMSTGGAMIYVAIFTKWREIKAEASRTKVAYCSDADP